MALLTSERWTWPDRSGSNDNDIFFFFLPFASGESLSVCTHTSIYLFIKRGSALVGERVKKPTRERERKSWDGKRIGNRQHTRWRWRRWLKGEKILRLHLFIDQRSFFFFSKEAGLSEFSRCHPGAKNLGDWIIISRKRRRRKKKIPNSCIHDPWTFMQWPFAIFDLFSGRWCDNQPRSAGLE